jgi:hypothetical protein
LHAGYEAIPATALVCRKQYIYKSPKRFGSSHCPCPPHHQPENATAPPRLCARPPVPDGENARRDGSNFTAGLCQHHNNTVARPGSPGPNPITHPCDTETDSDPDPELASPWTFSDILELCPEAYTYTAKRYTYTYTMTSTCTGTGTTTNGCRSARPLSESGSGSESESGSVPTLIGTSPSWTAPTSPLGYVSTITTRLHDPVLRVPIPLRILAIPRPIATPTLSLTPSEKVAAFST